MNKNLKLKAQSSKQKSGRVLVGMSGGVAPYKFLLSNRLHRVMTVRPIRGKIHRVLCGVSGGVDSSVAAAILKKQGYEVIGVFLTFWHQPESQINADLKCNADQRRSENKCCDYESLMAARQVCNKLKIPFYVLDASKEFKKEVVDYFINEYDGGRTPNPCIVCNKKIKFGWMLDQARKLGCNYVATGHYSRVARENPNLPCRQAGPKSQILNKFKIQNSNLLNYRPASIVYSLSKAKDIKKDQSYFLWQLDQEQLSHILFPIGDYTKEEVRQMARKWKLPTAEKKESQDLCFINTNVTDFLNKYAYKLNKPGEIVNLDGNILGEHKGLCYYTVGQRQGIGIQIPNPKHQAPNKSQIQNSKFKIQKAKSYKLTTSFQPVYVIRLNVEKNQLIVGSKKDLNSLSLIAEKVNLIVTSNKLPVTRLKLKAKIRYGAPLSFCHIVTLSLNKIKVIFDKPQCAMTPGQSIVFYQGQRLIGGGIIEKTI